MTCSWMKVPGGDEWRVVIPEHEVHFERGGVGTYEVERRDGTSSDVVVVSLSAPRYNARHDCNVCYGMPEDAARDRAARVAPLSHSAPAPTRVRLTKQRDHVVAPVAVLQRAVRRHGGRVDADDLAVWVEDDDDDWHIWTVDGVRMAKAPIAAAKALV